MNPEAPVADQLKPNLSTSTPPTVGPKNALKIDCQYTASCLFNTTDT